LQLHSIHHIIQVLLGVPMARNDVVIRADIASARLAKLLEIRRGSPLLVREHRISGMDGVPILCGEAIYRAEFRFSYTMDPRRPADPLHFVPQTHQKS
jgi:DNA-binding GntR family transcriptional regulator